MLDSPSGSQVVAWEASIDAIRCAFTAVSVIRPEVLRWELVLEYLLPRERGRRPDMVLLAGPDVVVFEFKSTTIAGQPQEDQVKAYARDLANYHSGSHGRTITPVLVLAGNTAPSFSEGVTVVGSETIGEFLLGLRVSEGKQVRSSEWADSDYAPLPSLVTAARTIFQHKPLPFIRRAHSVGIPKTIASLVEIAEEAESTSSLHLALVTGVPARAKH
jgi:hypothetical protein